MMMVSTCSSSSLLRVSTAAKRFFVVRSSGVVVVFGGGATTLDSLFLHQELRGLPRRRRSHHETESVGVVVVRQLTSSFQQQQRRFFHNFAISREVPDSFVDALSDHQEHNSEVSIEIARQQHESYLAALREHVPTLSLPALEDFPDCVFVEDTVLAGFDKGTALLMNPGHETRRFEVESIYETLTHRLGMTVTKLTDLDSSAVCDGGDVLNTGRHVFVGLSQRTNMAGYDAIRQYFMQLQSTSTTLEGVMAVPVPAQVLHLKSAVSHLDESTLLIPQGSLGDAAVEVLEPDRYGYTDVIRLPHPLACNVVVVEQQAQRHVLANQCCAASKQILQQALDERSLGVTWLDISELAKKDSALTCSSVLLHL